MLSTDFQKNCQKIPILSMLNLRLKIPMFSEMGLRVHLKETAFSMHIKCLHIS